MKSALNSFAGFTMIELLVAIAMTALIGLAANSMLDVMLRSGKLLNQQQAQLIQLDSGLRIIQRDLQQLVPRQLKGDDFTTSSFGMLLRPVSEAVGSSFMEFIRFSASPSLRHDTTQLIRVRYRLLDTKLIREQRPFPAMPDQQSWHKIVVLEEISAIKIQLYTQQWRELFGNYRATELPLALQLTFQHPYWQNADLVVALPTGNQPDEA
ncbi:type II secretion system minor pseudopilin GspJ [Aliamphritea ceti]|uniref:type II secretion system minor pseudopilin GspJ n=1 Tax=Aliamphritea ceti TaxID=1524258 RepID=UPI0021C3253A|nr:type II secretion system minor pseudopilin GspJ [Aliamphritea ceti]